MIETKFKDTEIGRIPEDWDVCALRETITVLTDFTANGSFGALAANVPYFSSPQYARLVRLTDLRANFKNSDAVFITKKSYDYLSKSKLFGGEILLANVGAYAGLACIFPFGMDFIATLGPNMFLIKFKSKLDINYVFNSCNFGVLHNQLLIKASSSAQPKLNKEDVRSCLIPLPSKEEQTRIACALMSIDNLISSLDKLVEKKKNIKQGAMQQLLTGKKRLKGFTEPWVECQLGDVSRIYRGGSPRPIEEYMTSQPDGLNWIKIGDVSPKSKYIVSTKEKIKPSGASRSRFVKKGDFILSNSMSFGRPYILNVDGCIHDGWLVIQDYQDTFNLNFLYYVLGSEEIIKQYNKMAAGSSVQNLNKEKVASVMVNIPTSKDEQAAIADILSSMDNEILALEANKVKYEKIKQGMMQQLLTGRIRLIEKY